MSRSPDSHVVVPEGYAVVEHGALTEPRVQRSDSGLILAHFGAGGDDPNEIFALIEQARAFLESSRNAPAALRFVPASSSLREIFSGPVQADEVRGGAVVWTAREDGLAPVLGDPVLVERLFLAWQTLGSVRQVLAIADSAWTTSPVFESALREANIDVFQSETNEPVLLEVRPPVGAPLHGFVGRAPVVSAEPLPVRALLRAPRLRRLALDAVFRDGLAALKEELRARRAPLVFLVDARGAPPLMTWPGERSPSLPVFGDLTALERARREIGGSAETLGVAAMRPAELAAWAGKAGFGAVLGVYPDEGEVRYAKIVL